MAKTARSSPGAKLPRPCAPGASAIPTPWPGVRHQVAKLQGEDMRYIKTHPRRGFVCDVEDFSQNGNIKPKREHVSRYFSDVGYTLYGLILTGHLDDFKNITLTDREQLRDYLTKKGLPLCITESHLVISADLTHDAAAVMHFNDKLRPYSHRISRSA